MKRKKTANPLKPEEMSSGPETLPRVYWSRESWRQVLGILVATIGNRQKVFTTDDLWEAGLPTGFYTQDLGGVIRGLRTTGLIEPTGYHVPSRRPSRRGSLVAVWRLRRRAPGPRGAAGAS